MGLGTKNNCLFRELQGRTTIWILMNDTETLQHCWSHFLRDLSRCLQFHSYLCHHAGCLPTVAFPSEFQGLQKKERGEEKTNKGRSACRWRIGIQCQHLWKSFQILQHKKNYRNFLRSVHCKPQAAFLGCVLAGLVQQQDPGPHVLPDFNNTTSWPFLLYLML